jgi:hypothetical protein
MLEVNSQQEAKFRTPSSMVKAGNPSIHLVSNPWYKSPPLQLKKKKAPFEKHFKHLLRYPQ